MARGNYRTSDKVCTYCGFNGNNNEIIMPHSTGKGSNKCYMCCICFDKNNKCDCNVKIGNDRQLDPLRYY